MTTRRAFLQLGAAAGGALVLGIDLAGCALVPGPGRIERHFDATGEFKPSAWLRILPDDRIVFTLDRVEMGQGTMTSHATLVAEELEVDPARIEVELAGASRAFDNPDPDLRFQVTGGSTSLRTSWRPLREAGATALAMLRAAAAATWGVPAAECTADAGAIVHPAGHRATYGALAAAAARQPVPTRVALRDPKDFRWIGTAVPRLDARAKVDGSAVYGIDVRIPDMVYATIVRPPVRGGRLRRFDPRVRERPGVVDAFEVDQGVAIVARSTWEARRAADGLAVEWDEGGFARVDSATIEADYARLAARRGAEVRDDGDAYRALRGAARTVEATYLAPYLAHATMEPMNCTAHVTERGCEIWAPTQAPGIARQQAADALGLDVGDVVLHQTLLGGGFGRRLWQDYVVETVMIAHKLRRPVQVLWSREDDQANDFYRPLALSVLRGAIDARGRVVAWLHRLVSQSIVAHEGGDFVGALLPDGAPRPLRRLAAASIPRAMARGTIADTTSTEGAVDLPYAIPNLRVEYTVAETGVPVGFWRAVGHSHNAFVTEAFLDELIAAAGQDAFAARRALLADRPRERRVLELAADKAGWGSAPRAGVGRGIAVHTSFGSVCAHVVEASDDGGEVRVRRVVSAIDCGRVVNPDLVRAQIESAVVFGLSAALKQQITFAAGRVRETNFDRYPLLRMHECPPIEVHLVAGGDTPTGVGEPGVPPVAPALCGAIFAASGRRVRRLPIEAPR